MTLRQSKLNNRKLGVLEVSDLLDGPERTT